MARPAKDLHLFRGTRPPFLRLAGLFLGVVLLSLAAVAAFSRVEENDAFCTACHLPAEDEYVRRAEAARAVPQSPVDLASRHATEGIPCVGCHRGTQSLSHRAAALGLGAWNAARFLAGNRGGKRSNLTARWLPEASCWTCHQEAIRVEAFEKHFHNMLPEYLALDQVVQNPENRILCGDCHPSHREGEVLIGFIEDAIVFPTCEKCHVVWERGPRGLGATPGPR